MAINKVEICGMGISTLPVLKNERMRELFPKIHAATRTRTSGMDAGIARARLLSMRKERAGEGE